MLHYLNGVKRLIKKAVKKTTSKPVVKAVSKRTKNVINKAMATKKGQQILSKSPAGRKIVKVQRLKEAGKITPKVAQSQIKTFAKAYETEAKSNELLDRMDKAVTNELIKDINETPAPEVIQEEEAQDLQEGVNEVNEQEFDTPGSPDDETTGADGQGDIGRVKRKLGIKKIALAPVRGAFLGLVKLNVFKLADKLAVLYKKDFKGLMNLWTKYGGDFISLKKAINTKKTRISGIGSVTATASLISAATPLLIEIIKLFKRNRIPTDEIQTSTTETPTDNEAEVTQENEDTIGYYY
jgi:hypothetical protein